MFPYLLIRKHNSAKGKIWLAFKKAPPSAGKAHKLRSMQLSPALLLLHEPKCESMAEEYPIQQSTEIQAGPQCLKTVTECFIL